MDGYSILVAGLFGAVGTGFFMYGKKQMDYKFLISGIILLVYPYFVSDAMNSLLIGSIITIAPFILNAWDK